MLDLDSVVEVLGEARHTVQRFHRVLDLLNANSALKTAARRYFTAIEIYDRPHHAPPSPAGFPTATAPW